MPELTKTSPYVHSRVESNTFIMGNPMPESSLPLCQSQVDFIHLSGTLDLASESSFYYDSMDQRVLNDLYRVKLARGHIIQLNAHPLPSLSHQKVASLSQSPSMSPDELIDRRGGGGWGWTWNQIIRQLALYKSFNPLCPG
jgi:hypothetical protein